MKRTDAQTDDGAPEMRVRHRPRRVFVGLTDVAGYFGNMRIGLEAHGIPCYFIDESDDRFGYHPPTMSSRLGHEIAIASRRAAEQGWSSIAWRAALPALRAARLVIRLGVLVRAMLTCDVFVFGAGDGFFHGAELPLLHATGKRIVWVFTGSDHRPPYLNGRLMRAAEANGEAGFRRLARHAARLRARVRRAERYADVIIAHTASAQFHQRTFVRFLAVGIPHAAQTGARPERGRSVIVVHAPSDPISKGTTEIRRLVDSIRERGTEIDYRELIDRSHDQVVAELAAADILVNELYADTPLSVAGTEAAAAGTPTLSGGYYTQVFDELLPDLRPPAAYVLPDALEAELDSLARDRERREALGLAAQRFVRTRWSQLEVAGRILRLLEGDAPSAWLADPSRSRYLGGWGMSAGYRRAAVRRYVEVVGPTALALDDNPALRDALMEEVFR